MLSHNQGAATSERRDGPSGHVVIRPDPPFGFTPAEVSRAGQDDACDERDSGRRDQQEGETEVAVLLCVRGFDVLVDSRNQQANGYQGCDRPAEQVPSTGNVVMSSPGVGHAVGHPPVEVVE